MAHNPPIQHRKSYLTEEEQENVATRLSDFKKSTVYFEHINYINFTEFNLPRPIYINMVRDPVERAISWFYFIRTPWYFPDRVRKFPNFKLPHPKRLKMNLEACIKADRSECSFKQNQTDNYGSEGRQSMFYCGHSATDCYPFNSLATLQIAKRNVEADYAVVGTWEETNVTLAVLEAYIPRYFKGVQTMYNIYQDQLNNVNRNTFKPEVQQATKELLRKNFTNEIEFYEFCKQRLYKQYFALNLDPDFKIN